MIKAKTIIIGGGASGLLCAVMHDGSDVIVLERGERVGRKLSATGNGQGNVTNVGVCKDRYFSVNGDCGIIEKTLCSANGYEGMLALLEDLGGCFMPDSKGRVYPTGKQASAVTDLLRYRLDYEGKKTVTGALVTSVKKKGNEFIVETDGAGGKTSYLASNVVVATGGKASKNFGTDGNGYALIKSLGHTVTPLYPSLVQIKTEVKDIKTLKGIRVYSKIQAYLGGKKLAEETGDVIFADYGVSGDAVFRLSAFITDKMDRGVNLVIDLLPEISYEKLVEIIKNKQKNKSYNDGELLCGILNNQVGRAVLKRANSTDAKAVASVVKGFTLTVTGSLGYDYAQVTKGGIPLKEVNQNLESKTTKGLYFTGEILDVDGECGGYNLQWAYSSAKVVADAINLK